MLASWFRSTARTIAGSRIVRCLHATGVRRRCDQPADGATLCRIGEHVCVFCGGEGLSGSSRQTVAFYSDKHSIFRVSKENAASGDGMTQFGRALSELNIEILCANTSQAKGRVERAHSTLQDRLVKELRLAGISTIEEANAFLPGFVANYNGRFAKPPARDRICIAPSIPSQDLDQILCWREQRQVSHQLVVNYNQMKLTLKPRA